MKYEFKNLGQMFFSRMSRYTDNPALRYKKDGQWVDVTWKEAGDSVKAIASALLAIGVKRGDKISIQSQSRLEWVLCDIGALSIGAITVPIYPSNTAEQSEYIINDSEAKVLIVENLMQLDKIKQIRQKIPNVIKIIVIKELTKSEDKTISSLDELINLGKSELKKNDEQIKKILEEISIEDVATLVYTSGTTGSPKGVIQTHKNHIAMSTNLYKVYSHNPGDINLLFLPLAHSFARGIEFFGIYSGTGIMAFAESVEKIAQNLVEVKPQVMASVPRIFEKVYQAVLSGAQASPVKKKIFDWALEVGKQVSRLIQKKQPVPLGLRIKRSIAHKLVFSKLHAKLGGRIRFFISGGAPLSRDIAEFFHAAGILILEGYGLTETVPATHINRIDGYKFGTVGQLIPGVEVKIAPDGEIIVRGDNIATKGYFKKPEATAESFTADGWFKTGDIGEIDSEGFLKITDRKKDMIKTAGGKFVAPQNIENILKTDPFVSQAVVIGDQRPYCVVLIAVNKEEAEKFAKGNGIQYKDYSDLIKNPQIRERVKHTIDAVNSKLASFESLKKFELLPQDLTQEGGELTPTLKVKRKVIMQKYNELVDSMYKN
ncbi:MAG TPA: long-chain fatty acid--CoA ligase [bacterium]